LPDWWFVMEINHDYRVKLFDELGFERKQCTECNQWFWTLDKDRTTCGDSPCDEYSFIGSPKSILTTKW